MVIVISLEEICALNLWKKDHTIYFSIHSFKVVFIMIWHLTFKSLSFQGRFNVSSVTVLSCLQHSLDVFDAFKMFEGLIWVDVFIFLSMLALSCVITLTYLLEYRWMCTNCLPLKAMYAIFLACFSFLSSKLVEV